MKSTPPGLGSTPEICCNTVNFFAVIQAADSQAKVQENLINHLYEELAKRKALVEKVNKLESEVDRLDSVKAGSTEKSVLSSSPSPSGNSSINVKPCVPNIKAVLSPYPAGSSPLVSNALVNRLSPGTPGASSASVLLSGVPVSQHGSLQPQIVTTHPSLLRPVVGVPVQMVSCVDKDGKLVSPSHKTKATKQIGNVKKKPRASKHSSKPLSSQASSTAASPSTPAVPMLQSPSVSRSHQPLLTSPLARSGSEPSSVTVVTSPVTPTPVRRVTSDFSSVVPLPGASSASQRPTGDVPPMVSFVQNGLSYISPLSPLSSVSVTARPPTSCSTPLSSLSASTEKYLNTFTTQSTATPKASFSNNTSHSPPVINSSHTSYSNRSPYLNTDLSTDHSAGIKLLCDLLNDTLPEQPPPLIAASLAVRSLGTPSSLQASTLIPDSSKGEEKKQADSPLLPASKSGSNSSRTPLLRNTATSPSPEKVSSPLQQTPLVEKSPSSSETPVTKKKRTSPFSIENLVSSSPESQSGKRNLDELQSARRNPSPADISNGSSPKGKNKSPSTNFSIAHITRDINTANNKCISPSVTGPLASSAPVSEEVSQRYRRRSPPEPRLSNPESNGTGIGAADADNSATDSVSEGSSGVDKRRRVLAPVARVCGPSTEMLSQSRLVSKELSSVEKINNLTHQLGSPKIPSASTSCTSATSTPKDQIVSNEGSSTSSSSNKISSSGVSDHEINSSATFELSASVIPDIPLDLIPLPRGKRPSPEKVTNQTGLSRKKRRSPVPAVPKSKSPDSEVSSLMTNVSLPPSSSTGSSVSKSEAAVLEGQAPVLVDSNPCSARSPIPVAPSTVLQPHAGVSLPSFGSVFSLPKEGAAAPDDSTQLDR